ncbi:MLO-like protein 3 isoform X1 [Cucurbita moschata]|uniref:MLO-like protein n=1 Tax=Cucurbita moschata TaxID=3662 RepID=A0A6J1GC65_CUCMO|nr:MLO-like protein 3 isoform X1 [Cucurbita moschata]
MAAAAVDPSSLQFTPTWAVAAVCFIFISLSLFLEHLIHLLSNWLKRKRKTALFDAVEKLKSVLMLLGFMSLTLTVTQQPVSKICIPNSVAYTMLPCQREIQIKADKNLEMEQSRSASSANRSFSWMMEKFVSLAAESEDSGGGDDSSSSSSSSSSSDYCTAKGKTSLISQGGMNQLNNFIFVLAVMQIVYSVLTMALGKAKMRRWKAWEEETHTLDYQVANDPNRFRFTRQTTFGRRHISSCASPPLLLWTKCFFRQFFRSVAKVDYLTLRHGFISTHIRGNTSFNFQKYIERSLHDDFKVVVGMSPFMWLIVVIFILVDVHGWNAYLWVSFLPLIIVLALGTKLEVIVARLALELQHKTDVIKGAPMVEPSDDLFWFNHPKFVLTLLHFTLFMNAFELSFIIWVTLQYGINSCYHEKLVIIIIRIVLAVTVQILCSYSTLPLYALVTQMGSQFKAAALEEHTAKAIKKWHQDVKQKRKQSNHHQYLNDLDPSQHQEGSSPFVAGRLSSMVSESSNKTQSSQELTPFHHRAPTFSELNYLDIESNEIVEELTETTVIKDESIVVDRSIGIKIGEISEVHEGETETHIT